MNRKDAKNAKENPEIGRKRLSLFCFAPFAPLRFVLFIILLFVVFPTAGQVLDKQNILHRQTFWDNRDWEWYKQNIPIFESPDAEIDATYYYRWELVTRHLVYASPATGYVYTEFMDRPFWS